MLAYANCRIRQYFPDFYSGFEPEEVSIRSTDELRAVPWVAQWIKRSDFHRLSLSDGRLIAELDGGYKWWVVGSVIDGALDLPVFEPKKRGAATAPETSPKDTT